MPHRYLLLVMGIAQVLKARAPESLEKTCSPLHPWSRNTRVTLYGSHRPVVAYIPWQVGAPSELL